MAFDGVTKALAVAHVAAAVTASSRSFMVGYYVVRSRAYNLYNETFAWHWAIGRNFCGGIGTDSAH